MSTEDADLHLAGLSLWVLGRQFPDHQDFWDGNWLNVRVRVEASGAVVEAQGPIIHGSELRTFTDQLVVLDRNLTGTASLQCREPNLELEIALGPSGQAMVTVRITPDHLTQSHEFMFSADQTYLKPLIAECQKVLSYYTIRGDSKS